MRITNPMTSGQIQGNLSSSLERMYDLQSQAATLKRLRTPSDDPSGVSLAIGVRATLAGAEQYARNLQHASALLKPADTALATVTSSLNAVKGFMASAINSTNDAQTRETLARQVESHMDVIASQMNTRHMDRAIFGGYRTDTDPVTRSAPGNPLPYVYNGDAGVLRVAINDNSTLPVSVTAQQVLNLGQADATKPDGLELLQRIADQIRAGDVSGMQQSGAELADLHRNVVTIRATLGARADQVQAHQAFNEEQLGMLRTQLSTLEDADIVDTITRLQSEQNVYQAALYSTRMMTQTASLADYLR